MYPSHEISCAYARVSKYMTFDVKNNTWINSRAWAVQLKVIFRIFSSEQVYLIYKYSRECTKIS
jgi:hypothetical protein